jgi:hypothetical protein
MAILIATTSLTYAQKFHDVYIGGSIDKAVATYKAKGYKVIKFNSYGAVMQGTFNSEEIDLYIFMTPKTKQVCKVVAYLPERNTWDKLNDEYERIKSVLTEKYGEPTEDYSYYPSKYADEYSALYEGELDQHAIWFRKGNLNLMIKIDDNMQVALHYENITNMILKTKETKELQLLNL